MLSKRCFLQFQDDFTLFVDLLQLKKCLARVVHGLLQIEVHSFERGQHHSFLGTVVISLIAVLVILVVRLFLGVLIPKLVIELDFIIM